MGFFTKNLLFFLYEEVTWIVLSMKYFLWKSPWEASLSVVCHPYWQKKDFVKKCEFTWIHVKRCKISWIQKMWIWQHCTLSHKRTYFCWKKSKTPIFGKIPKKWKIFFWKGFLIYRNQFTKYVFLGYETRWTQWWRNFSLLKLCVIFRISGTLI
jgi:hypothetical protein